MSSMPSAELEALREVESAAIDLLRVYSTEEAMPKPWLIHKQLTRWAELSRALERVVSIRSAE